MPQTIVQELRDTLRPAAPPRIAPTGPAEESSPGPADAVARGAPAAARPSAAVRELLRRLDTRQLRQTTTRYPHVLEAIARDWPEPHRMHATLDALMYDERGGRAGFPPEVLAELAELRACYERWVGPRTARGR